MKYIFEDKEDLKEIAPLLGYNEQRVFWKFRLTDISALIIFGRTYTVNELNEIFSSEEWIANCFGFNSYDEYEREYYY
jgi:hypothetical protein